MWKYILRRLVQVIPVLFLISVASFGLLTMMPGDPIELLRAADPEITAADLENLRSIYGLDQPFHTRYVRWLSTLILERDLGMSRQYRRPVTDLIAQRMPNTIYLVFSSFFLALIVSIPLGIYAALRQYSPGDYFLTGFAFFGFSIPNHWLGLLLIYLFAVHLRILPAGGFRSLAQPQESYAVFFDRLQYLILPALTLSMSWMASWMRYMRSSMLEVIRDDYVRTARAKGLSERVVTYKHALRNALLPIITLVMLAVPFLFGGAVITEAVFSYPGMGQLLWTSLVNHDNFTTMAIVMLLAVLVVTFNLLADIVYAWVDPRIRFD